MPEQKTIVIASANPVKCAATEGAFRRMFPNEQYSVISVAVSSGVSDQPQSDEESLRGAENRAAAAREAVPNADFWVGMEGGVEDTEHDMYSSAWVVVVSPFLSGKGKTGTFVLPERVRELVRSGKELGEADDIVFGRTNSKQEEGAIGLLTGGVITRASLYEHAAVLALIPFKQKHLYGNTG